MGMLFRWAIQEDFESYETNGICTRQRSVHRFVHYAFLQDSLRGSLEGQQEVYG